MMKIVYSKEEMKKEKVRLEELLEWITDQVKNSSQDIRKLAKKSGVPLKYLQRISWDHLANYHFSYCWKLVSFFKKHGIPLPEKIKTFFLEGQEFVSFVEKLNRLILVDSASDVFRLSAVTMHLLWSQRFFSLDLLERTLGHDFRVVAEVLMDFGFLKIRQGNLVPQKNKKNFFPLDSEALRGLNSALAFLAENPILQMKRHRPPKQKMAKILFFPGK